MVSIVRSFMDKADNLKNSQISEGCGAFFCDSLDAVIDLRVSEFSEAIFEQLMGS